MIDPTAPDFSNTPASKQRPLYPYTTADKTAPPQLSLITPFYNVDPSLFSETVRSIRRQSFQQFEWLVVNDGSTDPAALEYLNKLRDIDPRLRVLDHPQNRGLSAARNSGFRAARTELVALLDADDLLEPTALEKWLWFMHSHPAVSFTRGYSVRFGTGGTGPHLWPRGFEVGPRFLIKNQFEPTSMIRRSVWQKIDGFAEEIRGGLEDWEFWLRAAAHGYWGATVPEYLNWYRLSLQQTRWANLRSEARMMDFRLQLQKKFSALYQQNKFPHIPLVDGPMEAACPTNPLQKPTSIPHLLYLTHRRADLLPGLNATHHLTICTSDPTALAQFAPFTPDIFHLPHFLTATSLPHFLHYLHSSRQFNLILLGDHELRPLLLPLLLELPAPHPTLIMLETSTPHLISLAHVPRPALNPAPLEQLDDYSAEALAWQLSPQKIIKLIGFKLAAQPGLSYLYHLKRLLKHGL